MAIHWSVNGGLAPLGDGAGVDVPFGPRICIDADRPISIAAREPRSWSIRLERASIERSKH